MQFRYYLFNIKVVNILKTVYTILAYKITRFLPLLVKSLDDVMLFYYYYYPHLLCKCKLTAKIEL